MVGRLLLHRGGAHVGGDRPAQLLHVSVSVGRRRVGELAGRHQDGRRVVSPPGERVGGGAVRLWVVNRRRRGAVAGADDLSRIGQLAPGIRRHGAARLRVVADLPVDVSAPGVLAATVTLNVTDWP